MVFMFQYAFGYGCYLSNFTVFLNVVLDSFYVSDGFAHLATAFEISFTDCDSSFSDLLVHIPSYNKKHWNKDDIGEGHLPVHEEDHDKGE